MSSVAIKDNSEIKVSANNVQVGSSTQIENPIVEDESSSVLQLLESLTETIEASTGSSKTIELNASEFSTEKKETIQKAIDQLSAASVKIESDLTGKTLLDALKLASAYLTSAQEELLTGDSTPPNSATPNGDSKEVNPFKQATSSSYLMMAQALGSLCDHIGNAEESLSIQAQYKSDANRQIGATFIDQAEKQQAEIEKQLQEIEKLLKEAASAAKMGAIAGYILAAAMVVLACCTCQPELIVLSITMLALTVPTDGKVGGKGTLSLMTDGISRSLQKDGMSKKDADITAAVITIVVVGMVTLGAGAAYDAAFASETAATTAAESSTETTTGTIAEETGSATTTTTTDINNTATESFFSRFATATQSAKNKGLQSMMEASTAMMDGFWGKLANSIDEGNSDLLITMEVIGALFTLYAGYKMSEGMTSAATANATSTAAKTAQAAKNDLLSQLCDVIETNAKWAAKKAYDGMAYAAKPFGYAPTTAVSRLAQLVAFAGGIVEATAAGEQGTIYAGLAEARKILTEALAGLTVYQTSLDHMDSEVSSTSDLIAMIGQSLSTALQQGLSYQQTLARLQA